LRPVIAKADEIGSVVLEHPKHGDIIRRFFTVTLDAFEHFVESLLKNHEVMGRIEEEKAMQSIEVFRKDLLAYEARLSAKRRFDFQVLTDVIKHRLRK
jgi:excinuclease UvrABC helicase subunit UvrB